VISGADLAALAHEAGQLLSQAVEGPERRGLLRLGAQDHRDVDSMRAALQARPELTLWANPQVTAQFTEFGERVHEIREGDVLSVFGFDVHVYGHDHALIHKDIPLVVNHGFLLDGELFHRASQESCNAHQ
jgi:hypothetical protein